MYPLPDLPIVLDAANRRANHADGKGFWPPDAADTAIVAPLHDRDKTRCKPASVERA
jgi:hypothetical protein